MRFDAVFKLFTALAASLLTSNLFAAGKASHVVLIVWDGMRPDFVTPATTSNLVQMAQQGVVFKNHHPVFVSSTEVNATALATGVYPGQSDVIGNNEFRPAINPTNKIMTADLKAIRKADALTDNHYLAFPTVAEILHGYGRVTAVAGAKSVTVIADRAPRSDDSLGANLFDGETLPGNLAETLGARLGKLPAPDPTKAKRDRWTTEALTGTLWEKGVPAFSLLWLSEPDFSQHATGPGSPTSLAAIKSSDENLGRVLAALKAKQADQDTDVIVVSDHAFSTIAQKVNLVEALSTNGFSAAYKLPTVDARKHDIFVIGNGGAAFLYVPDHNPALTERVAHWLQTQPFSGVVLTRQPIEGAFRLADAKVNSPDAPDIVLSMRWSPDRSSNGTPGLLCSTALEYAPGTGMHGSLSPYDMHNTCIAAGPDFRAGFTDELPTGNIDIAPTILWLLNAAPPQRLSGRVLYEAMSGETRPVPAPQSHHLEAQFKSDGAVWKQYLDYTVLDGVTYFDRGNGESVKP